MQKYRQDAQCSPPFLRPLILKVDISQSLAEQSQAHGYMSSHRALPLSLGRYSLLIPLELGS